MTVVSFDYNDNVTNSQHFYSKLVKQDRKLTLLRRQSSIELEEVGVMTDETNY